MSKLLYGQSYSAYMDNLKQKTKNNKKIVEADKQAEKTIYKQNPPGLGDGKRLLYGQNYNEYIDKLNLRSQLNSDLEKASNTQNTYINPLPIIPIVSKTNEEMINDKTVVRQEVETFLKKFMSANETQLCLNKLSDDDKIFVLQHMKEFTKELEGKKFITELFFITILNKIHTDFDKNIVAIGQAYMDKIDNIPKTIEGTYGNKNEREKTNKIIDDGIEQYEMAHQHIGINKLHTAGNDIDDELINNEAGNPDPNPDITKTQNMRPRNKHKIGTYVNTKRDYIYGANRFIQDENELHNAEIERQQQQQDNEDRRSRKIELVKQTLLDKTIDLLLLEEENPKYITKDNIIGILDDYVNRNLSKYSEYEKTELIDNSILRGLELINDGSIDASQKQVLTDKAHFIYDPKIASSDTPVKSVEKFTKKMEHMKKDKEEKEQKQLQKEYEKEQKLEKQRLKREQDLYDREQLQLEKIARGEEKEEAQREKVTDKEAREREKNDLLIERDDIKTRIKELSKPNIIKNEAFYDEMITLLNRDRLLLFIYPQKVAPQNQARCQEKTNSLLPIIEKSIQKYETERNNLLQQINKSQNIGIQLTPDEYVGRIKINNKILGGIKQTKLRNVEKPKEILHIEEEEDGTGLRRRRKGKGLRTRRVMYGRGLGHVKKLDVEPQKRITWVELGSKMVHKQQLENQGLLNVVYKNKFARYPKFPKIHVSDELKDFVLEMIDNGGRFNERYYNQLNPSEKEIFYNMMKACDLQHLLNHNGDNFKQKQQRYEILIGEISAGNDSKQLKQELRDLVIDFMNTNKVNKERALGILYEYDILNI